MADSRWTRDIPEDSKEKFLQALLNDTLVLGKMLSILENEAENLKVQEIREDSFDDPNWAFKQAYLNGQRNSLRKTIALLSFLKD